MVEIKTPECCKKFMELKGGAVSPHLSDEVFFFQCNKCGRVEAKWED